MTTTSEPSTTDLPTFSPGTTLTVGQHEVVDLLLCEEPGPGNPFDAAVRVTLNGPEGAVVTVPAFWDSRRGHIARVSFPQSGTWSVTVSEAGELNLAAVSFQATVGAAGSERRGGPTVDKEHPRSLVFADGTRFFPIGYEVDWLLMIDQRDHSLARVTAFLDTIQDVGFTMVTVNAYAHSFRRHVPEDLESDPRWIVPSFAPWVGGNEAPDYGSFDPDFFEHMDRVVAELDRRGLIVHLMLHVYNKDVNWPELGSPDDDRYWRYMVARYQAFTSIFWDTAKESYHQSADYIWRRLALIRRHDGYRRLLTAHDVNIPPGHDWGESSRRYADPDKDLLDNVVDVISDQVLLDIYNDALTRTTRFAKPYINIEFAYESGLDDLPSDAEDHDQDWREVTRRHWQVTMGGAYPNYYYRNTAWSLFVPDPTPPGYAAIRVLADFWKMTRYWLLRPAPELVRSEATDVYARANEGSEYVVYSQSGHEFELELPESRVPARCEWWDPYTGHREAGPVARDGARVMSCRPPSAGDAAVLYVTY
ncbi:hypothetical protein GCM10023169_35780 [Georgenia halophila]|uniref:Apiosidase-like catalytic domain-containing protein n=1 Tax=Georgenia halophila TaxID=620889 RepID=A0ABP8LM23_9MICO